MLQSMGSANSDVTDRRNTNQGPEGMRLKGPSTQDTCFLPQERG